MAHDQGIPVLTYHSLDTTGSVISTDPGVFRSQMESLAARGFAGIRADQLIAAWNERGTLPAKPVVLTFDDGFANFSEIAMPILLDLGFCGTVYVIAGRAGQMNDWPGQPSHIPRLPLMTWDAVGAVATAGFEIGDHTSTHRDLRMLAGDALESEMGESRRIIARQTGATVTTFAYPYGHTSREAVSVARSHYAAAFGTELGVVRSSDDRYQMRRIDMYYYKSPLAFRFFGTAVGASYMRVRGLGRAMRGVLRGSSPGTNS